jgi:hypothetical protein
LVDPLESLFLAKWEEWTKKRHKGFHN